MKKLLLLCLSALIVLSVSAQHVPKSLTAANGQFIGFYQYTPTDYSSKPDTKYPLIIFLHGIGERGNGTTDLKNILGLGVPGAINAGHNMTFTWNGKTETFLVLSPQLSGAYGGWQNFYVDEMIEYAKKNLRIDENRIFLTGLSLGGGGVWQYAGATLDNAKKFAGIGLCCAVCPYINFSNLTNANLPIWAFHAQDDYTVGVGCTTNGIASINKLNPAVKPYMTIWPDGGHWIWGRVFDVAYNSQNPNLYEWFLGQNKSLPVNKRPVANAGADLATSPSTGIVTLSGSKSTDADGKLVRYIWTKISGPGAGTIATPVSTNGTTLVTGLSVAGTYQYELKVVDDRCDWTMDTVNVVVSAGPPPAGNKAPVVNAGNDITVMQPQNQVTLNGSATDADGSIISYSWIKTSGPEGNQIVNPNSASTQVTGLLVGTYIFKLVAVDNQNVAAGDDVTVVILPSDGRNNTGVDPGPNVTITLPTSTITLDGTASYDPYGGKINGWRWTKLSGPTGGTVANAGVSVTTASGLTEGVYVFQLTTWNSQWVPQSANKIVTVIKGSTNPVPPTQIANAGADQTITLPTNSVTLNGSGSVDPYGPVTGIGWTKVSGPAATITTASALTTTVTGLVEGTYTFRLQVTNTAGVNSTDDVVITVKAATKPVPPTQIANAGVDQTITLPTSSVTLNGSGSVDPYGAVTGIGWTKVSGPAATITTASALTTTATSLVEGTYTFRLQVTNTAGVVSTDDVVITVKAATKPESPRNVANAGADQTITLPTNSVTLNGSQSIDPNGALLGIGWTKISGPAAFTIANTAALTTTATGLVEGTYKFRLTVYNTQWVPSSDTVMITVKAGTKPVPPAQIANAGADQTITLPTNSVTLNGSGSVDPYGAVTGIGWTKVSGPAATITSGSSLTTTATSLVEGTYTFRLQVTNTAGVVSTDDVVITVKAAVKPETPRNVANAGADQTITLPISSVTLNGSGSVDPTGNLAAVGWFKISGPAGETITNSKVLTTTVTGLVAGTYQFRLLVYNSQWVPSSDTMIVIVKPGSSDNSNSGNNPSGPSGNGSIANAGPDRTVTLPVASVIIDGTASKDPKGSIVNWFWRKMSGPAGDVLANEGTSKLTVSNLVAGTYSYRLTCWGQDWVPAADTMVLTVLPSGAATMASTRTATAAITEEVKVENKLVLYPNPAQAQITVQTSSATTGAAYVNVYDMTGKLVQKVAFQKLVPFHQQVLNITSLVPGLYQVEVIISGETRLTSKFIKQ
ncbi:PKD domain-containing protein [Paraflavitalea pollutisoli]|uniref:PKD domain-containing protein n=1 Tax=Paraflavitalea pollutisoli TaxID=3034143 RepID=UPI0023EC5865|nr:T9SS type A sorting domain-containing protein [Paraflavitalea sp. H1-2-19X]